MPGVAVDVPNCPAHPQTLPHRSSTRRAHGIDAHRFLLILVGGVGIGTVSAATWEAKLQLELKKHFQSRWGHWAAAKPFKGSCEFLSWELIIHLARAFIV